MRILAIIVPCMLLACAPPPPRPQPVEVEQPPLYVPPPPLVPTYLPIPLVPAWQ
jgi:hypothetical protein